MLTKEESINNFNTYISRIRKWNLICENSNLTNEQIYAIQVAVTCEEINETIAAIINCSFTDTIDGICDVMVTAGYLAFLNSSSYYITDFGEKKGISIGEIVINLRQKLQDAPRSVTLLDVCELYVCANKIFDIDLYMDAVLKSNDSKILDDGDFTLDSLDKEIKYCQEFYKDKHEDIIAVESEYAGNLFYIIRSDNGNGKILKPSIYISPQKILGQSENKNLFLSRLIK